MLKMVALLLLSGADPLKFDDRGYTPPHVGQCQIIRFARHLVASGGKHVLQRAYVPKSLQKIVVKRIGGDADKERPRCRNISVCKWG